MGKGRCYLLITFCIICLCSEDFFNKFSNSVWICAILYFINVFAALKDGFTPLTLAVSKKKEQMVEVLVKEAAEVNPLERYSYSFFLLL